MHKNCEIQNPITCYRKNVLYTGKHPTMERVVPLSEHLSGISTDNVSDDDIPAKGETQSPDTHLVNWFINSGPGWVDTKPHTLIHTDWHFTCSMCIEDIKNWCIKDIKNCLFQADLNRYGLKKDLVNRLHSYITTFKATTEPVANELDHAVAHVNQDAEP